MIDVDVEGELVWQSQGDTHGREQEQVCFVKKLSQVWSMRSRDCPTATNQASEVGEQLERKHAGSISARDNEVCSDSWHSESLFSAV